MHRALCWLYNMQRRAGGDVRTFCDGGGIARGNGITYSKEAEARLIRIITVFERGVAMHAVRRIRSRC